jgi:16S rRNA U516 pseudouridylate synthase RsuA-like enzyme
MFDALNYFVEKLIRVRVGTVALGHLPPGEFRPLSEAEINSLKRAVGL